MTSDVISQFEGRRKTRWKQLFTWTVKLEVWRHIWDSGLDAKSKHSASPIVYSSELASVLSLSGVTQL